jgi:hypothetical protein
MRVCESFIHARVPCLNGPIVCDNLIHIGGDFSHSAKGILIIIIFKYLGVHGGMVNVIDLKPLALHCCMFESYKGLWIIDFDEAI